MNIKANGNVDPNMVAAAYGAIAIWNAAIAHRHGPIVQFVDVSGDPRAAAQADVVLNLHAQGGVRIGSAMCKSGKKCQVPVWDTARANDRAWNSVEFTYEELVGLVVHEVDLVLGLGHAEPLYGINDVMRYGDPAGGFPAGVVSACNMNAFDYVWAGRSTVRSPLHRRRASSIAADRLWRGLLRLHRPRTHKAPSF